MAAAVVVVDTAVVTAVATAAVAVALDADLRLSRRFIGGFNRSLSAG
jgi:hypothetical protein